MAPSRHDWKIVDWDVKPQHNQPIILKTDVWASYFRIMSQYDTTFDLKINVGHCDLYFMVQWFCLIS